MVCCVGAVGHVGNYRGGVDDGVGIGHAPRLEMRGTELTDPVAFARIDGNMQHGQAPEIELYFPGEGNHQHCNGRKHRFAEPQ